MFKNFLLHTLFGFFSVFPFGPANSEIENRSTELGRPVRVLTEGISGILLRQVLDWNDLDEMDFSHNSDKLSEFDMLLVFVDEFEEMGALSIIEQLGLKENFTTEAGVHPFMISLSVNFKETEIPFPIIAVDRRQFYARDIACHPPFLRDIILQFDPNAVAEDEESYRTVPECIR